MLLSVAVLAQDSALRNLDRGPHLQGWWKFDETAGKLAADSSQHRRRGLLEGGLSFDRDSAPGRTGAALRFDGKKGVVRIAGYKGVLGIGPRSISVWIKTRNPAGEIVSWGKPDFGRMWILCFIRKHVGVHPKGGYYYMAGSVHDGEWHHVAAVLRRNDAPNLYNAVTLYLDGKIAAIDNIGLLDLWPIETEAGQEVTIGSGFQGDLDQLRIYDRALTDEEVAALYSAGG